MTMMINVDTDNETRLNAIVARLGQTPSFYVKQALEAHLENLEDLIDAEQRLADIQSGRSKVYSLEEVEKELDLAD